MPQDNSNHDEQPILSLIQQIKDGQINPETLNKNLRQRYVEFFLTEGYSTPQMAQILCVSEKTIKRDIDTIRERNLLTPDINLAKKIVGELVMNARIHHAQLMRLARSKEGKVSEKVQAEYYAHRVNIELTEKLQLLGYLPLRPNAIVGDVFHHFDNANKDKVLDYVSAQVIEAEKLALEAKEIPQEIQQELNKVQGFAQKIKNIKKDINKKKKPNEEAR